MDYFVATGGHDTLILPCALLQGLRLPPSIRVLDLEPGSGEDEPTPRIGAGHHKNPLKEPGVRCARDGGSVDQVGVPQSGDRVQSTRCTGPSNETELISASGNFSNDDGRA